MLISKEYEEEQRRLHKERDDYGASYMAEQHAPIVSAICEKLKIKELLDYGCGKGKLKDHLTVNHKMKIQMYDPGIEEFSGLPEPSEFVVSIDVLEHIEEDSLEDVLDHLEQVTKDVIFVTIHMHPAAKVLSDGRNAHLIQRPMIWWLNKFADRFDLQSGQLVNPSTFYIVATTIPKDDLLGVGS